MNAVALIVAFSFAAGGVSSISGHVLDAGGAPVAGARVFLEQGLGAALVESRSTAAGAYHFDDLRPGSTQVFASAKGLAFGGHHLNVALADTIQNLDIRLGNPGTLSGKVVNHEGKAVPLARITRVALLGDAKVSIPFAKLRIFGYTEPITDSEGRFTLSALPDAVSVALKVAHPDYAQEGAMGMTVGERNVRVTLYPGVLVTGNVLSRGTALPVANASINVRKSDPPKDTVVTRTRADGSFAVRLKPGTYDCQATGAAFRSPAGQRLLVTGQTQTQQVTLYVAGTGTIRGKVMDASSGEPIKGARITLDAYGAPAAIVRTGPTGEFEFTAAEGECAVLLDFAPGYLGPRSGGLKLHVTQGQLVEMPTFWLAPLPTYALQVIDADENPVPNAVVTILRPAQLGWRVADDQGRLELAFDALPVDGVVAGTVEHPSQPLGALFAIERDDARDALVQLLPLARVQGKVLSNKGAPIEGAVVDARFIDESIAGTLVLWRTLSGKDGAFAWDGVVPHVPQLCVASTPEGETGEGAHGESASFIISTERKKDIGRLVVPQGKKAHSRKGRRLKWYQNQLQCGDSEDIKSMREKPAVIIYCDSDEAPAVAEALATAIDLFQGRNLVFAVVVDGDFNCPSGALVHLKGPAPAAATTYLLNAEGTVVLETFGMPPVHALNALAPPGES